MKKMIAALVAACFSSLPACAATGSATYWFMAQHTGTKWCGYADERRMKAVPLQSIGFEAAKVQFKGGKITSLVYQFASESGDTNLVDEYAVAGDITKVRRIFTRVDPYVRVVLNAMYRGSRPSRLHIVSINTEGGKGSMADVLDAAMPEPTITPIDRFAFLKLVPVMERRRLPEYCAGK